jgi:hypothetical protein
VKTADLSTTLPRISCRSWWRWQTSCAFPLRKAHTRPCPMLRGRKSGYAPVEMTSLLQVNSGLLLESGISSSNKFVISTGA